MDVFFRQFEGTADPKFRHYTRICSGCGARPVQWVPKNELSLTELNIARPLHLRDKSRREELGQRRLF